MDKKIEEQLQKLEAKYNRMGQDLSSYLDGLLYADYLTYWDYIHLDTLLTLQTPKTGKKDEMIFICYHQITELYFKLILWELDQLCEENQSDATIFLDKINRVTRYFEQLVHSFNIMTDGMSREEFLKFRMSLLPSSGFQSAQYRSIEIASTDFKNLVLKEKRVLLKENTSIKQLYKQLYWQKGATELSTGKKTLTLKQFEKKYAKKFIEKAEEVVETNICQLYSRHFAQLNNPEITAALRTFDRLANVDWPLAHYRSAARYLQRNKELIEATGGTNWQQYLPPRFQGISYFPSLWTEEELDEWGKSWVQKEILSEE